MNKKLLILAVVPLGILLAGCSGAGDSGDVAAAEAAAKRAPKSAADLPAGMPDEAKRQAENAMKAGQAQQQQMDAQAEAMKKARAMGGGGG